MARFAPPRAAMTTEVADACDSLSSPRAMITLARPASMTKAPPGFGASASSRIRAAGSDGR
jgi:hypothetical protein